MLRALILTLCMLVSVSAMAEASIDRGILVDRSGTITTGGTSQQLAPANSTRSYLFVLNPATATEPLYINFTSAASAGASSIELPAGVSFTLSGSFISTETVTVEAATTAHAFTAKEH